MRGEEILVAGTVACGFTTHARERDHFEANVARPQTSAFGADAYMGVWSKAAALLHSFATTQCLVDGNKRTAWASAWLMLRTNEIVGPLNTPLCSDVAERFIEDVSAGGVGVDEVITQLQRFAS
ncbi:MAG: Fic family protein [Gordonia polyisoprenivorans]|nr:Fic family protein [Gordonia polyisoprenivorans]